MGALRRLADRVEDAAVERALADGWSWTDVAEALGVTRQAVHKKHSPRLRGGRGLKGRTVISSGSPRMLARPCRDARRSAVSAGDDTIEAEHLLLALAGRDEFDALKLDHDRLAEALADEERRSLASVGVNLDEIEPPRLRALGANRAWRPRRSWSFTARSAPP